MQAPYIWQRAQWQQLQAAQQQNCLSHAYLLVGQAGLGKFAFAEAWVESLLGAKHSPDKYLISGYEGIKIAQIRALIDFLQQSSHEGGLRIAIIASADKLNLAAANALLKILEEPPPNSLIILVTAQPQRLKATVRSRCQKIVFNPATAEQCRAYLGEAATLEAIALANGSPLYMESSHDQPILAARKQVCSEFLATLSQEQDPLLAADAIQAVDSALTLNTIFTLIRDCIVTQVTQTQAKSINIDYEANIHAAQQQLSLVQWFQLLDRLIAIQQAHSAQTNLNHLLQLEALFCELDAMQSTRALVC